MRDLRSVLEKHFHCSTGIMIKVSVLENLSRFSWVSEGVGGGVII